MSVDGLMAGGKGSLREENWRSGARFSDCCRQVGRQQMESPAKNETKTECRTQGGD